MSVESMNQSLKQKLTHVIFTNILLLYIFKQRDIHEAGVKGKKYFFHAFLSHINILFV